MTFAFTEVAGVTVAEVIGEGMVVVTAQDAVNLVANAAYQGASHVLLHVSQLVPAFFDLSSGLAGDVLQKFTNYRVGLSIIGEFGHLESQSLQAFIRESNRGQQIAFVPDRAAALARIAGRSG